MKVRRIISLALVLLLMMGISIPAFAIGATEEASAPRVSLPYGGNYQT